jgi:phospholipid/cholesterol/gamma-HCH transport system ATP-binding protein
VRGNSRHGNKDVCYSSQQRAASSYSLLPISYSLIMIKLVGVEKTLGGQPVLCGVDLTIPAGKLTTIIGRSGGGKSVLLKHMIGLLQPDRGEVWVDGIEISRLRGKALNEVRKRFAMLFQGAALFDSLTVFENVAFPLREKLRLADAEVVRRVEEKLEQVGLSGMGHKFPAELSGGMKKRAGLARALVMEPEIILFDEPTTGLDPLMAKTIHDLIVAMHRTFGFTAIMVSHEIPEIFSISDWVAMLKDGKIAAMAPSAEFQRTTDPAIREFIAIDGMTTVRNVIS